MKKFQQNNLIRIGFPALLCLMIITFTNSKVDSTVTRKQRSDDFSSVSLSMSANVYITNGSRCRIDIEASDEDLDKIETVVNNGTLEIKPKKWSDNIKNKVTVKIVMPVLKGLTVAGSGHIKTNSAFESDQLKLKISGSGSIVFEKSAAKKIDAVITGSGNIKLKGGEEAEKLGVTITGSGSYTSVGLKVSHAHVTITGSGSAHVEVVDELNTNITGSGNVQYAGNPLVNANSTGSGRTKKL